jgi:hypothetical protein
MTLALPMARSGNTRPRPPGPARVVSSERENRTLSRRVTKLGATAPVPLVASWEEPTATRAAPGQPGWDLLSLFGEGAPFAAWNRGRPRRRTQIDESLPDCFIAACDGANGKRVISRIRPDHMTSAEKGRRATAARSLFS